jgi:hypothetical protein
MARRLVHNTLLVLLVALSFCNLVKAQGNSSSSSTGPDASSSGGVVTCPVLNDTATEINTEVTANPAQQVGFTIAPSTRRDYKLDLCVSKLAKDGPTEQTFIQLSINSNVPIAAYIGLTFAQDATNSLYKCEFAQGQASCSVIFPACVYFSAGALYIGVHNPLGLAATGSFLLTLLGYNVVAHAVNTQHPLTPPYSQTYVPSQFNVTSSNAPVRVLLEVLDITGVPLDTDSVKLFVRSGKQAGIDRSCYTYTCEVNLVVSGGSKIASCSVTVSVGQWYYLVAYNRMDLTQFRVSLSSVKITNAGIAKYQPSVSLFSLLSLLCVALAFAWQF